MKEKNIKPVAFYLPQFHTIPENDKAHGEGFTEWTNTRKAVPLFEGHKQPKTPLGENYYCLLDEGVMREQAELAKKYGVYGFCYYHYWFKNGKKLLEKPIEMMLSDKSIDIPFCLCWANENWTRRWDGGNNEIIVDQDYGDLEDLKNHAAYLCKFFSDDRYIKIDGKPVLLVYKPELIPNLKGYMNTMRSEMKEHGFPDVIMVSQYPKYFCDGVSLDLFDRYVQFQPTFAQVDEYHKAENPVVKNMKKAMIQLHLSDAGKKVKDLVKKDSGKKELTIRSYDNDWESILSYKVEDDRLIAGAFTDWDNTPRNKNGLAYDDATPEKFGEYMKRLVKKIDSEYSSEFVFINAWNEWAEGAILEPDERFGYRYLEALKSALDGEA